MEVVNVSIDQLKHADYNPRQLTVKQHDALKESLSRFGFVDPLIVNKDNTVIGGHQRLKIAKELEIKEVPVVYLDLPKDKERELNVRLNANLGGWDFDILANNFDLKELTEWGVDKRIFHLPENPENQEPVVQQEKMLTCPNCGEEFTS